MAKLPPLKDWLYVGRTGSRYIEVGSTKYEIIDVALHPTHPTRPGSHRSEGFAAVEHTKEYGSMYINADGGVQVAPFYFDTKAQAHKAVVKQHRELSSNPRRADSGAPVRTANSHSVQKSAAAAEQYGKQAEATLRKAMAAANRGDKASAITLAMESTYLMGIADTHARYAGMRERNAYGWGAFLGSLAGTTLGSIFGLPGALAGSVAGAYYGGMHGLPSGRPSKKGAQWGAVGGVLGPITAGIAARVATDAGKSPNPQRTVNRLKK